MQLIKAYIVNIKNYYGMLKILNISIN